MLVHLSISNLAVIEAAELSFGPGLNALTGETGAGKSIVIGALSLVLGDRARSDTVRHGVPRAEVRALFHLSAGSEAADRLRALDLLGDEPEPGWPVELIVRRIVGANGRGRVYINGVLSTVGTLCKVTQGLVDISSQHQHTALLARDRHLALLDHFGRLEQDVASYQEAYTALVEAREQRDALRQLEQERLEREDFVRFQLAEITSVDPVAGEVELKAQERDRLQHAERLVQGALNAERGLAGGQGSAAVALAEAARAVARLADIDGALGPLAERLEQARIEVEDVAYDLNRYAGAIDADPRRLEELDDRIDALRRLQRKHGGSLEMVLRRAADLETELAGFASLEIDLKEAEAELATRTAAARERAERLTLARRGAAQRMGDDVTAELQSLAMSNAQVAMQLDPVDALGWQGQDTGELLIQTNPGEPLKPLSRVASGGELSRLLLAIKRALISIDPVPTCVFDEVDTGVGGAVAEVIGRKLAEIAHGDQRQVIAITHLPQIAAFGSHHLVVVKGAQDERVATTVHTLAAADRVDELARMLGGVEITETTRAHAEEMLRHGAAG